jgi:hypothetical protein
MDELEFTECESNMVDLISEYQQYQAVATNSYQPTPTKSQTSAKSDDPVKKMQEPPLPSISGPRIHEGNYTASKSAGRKEGRSEGRKESHTRRK